jgi:hypothetical protein
MQFISLIPKPSFYFKHFLFTCLVFLNIAGTAQQSGWQIDSIHLPPELIYFDNQFSCLNIHKKRLYLMTESRLLEKQEAKLYSIKLSDLDRKLADSAYAFNYQKHSIVGFDKLVDKMLKDGQICEGLEAMVIKGKDVWLSVETTPQSSWAYLLKGRLKNGTVYLDTSILLPVWKPLQPNGDGIFQACFESMEIVNGRLVVFFEYNYFEGDNYVFSYNTSLDADSKDSVKISRMPFRNSDIKYMGNGHFTAINSFYNGEGKDAVYRPPVSDTANYALVNNNGEFHNYARLVDIYYDGTSFTWQPLFVMPSVYEGTNWEGIVPYKNGYFIVNDKYTPAKPYYSRLLYLHP